jgi:hypothetical protein
VIGTALVEELVQSVALSHRVKGYGRVSALLLAAPESGKTTITSAAFSPHVHRVAMITGRSVLREIKDHPKTEFLLFNDLTTIRSMSTQATNLLVSLLNQITQGEKGSVAFAGKEVEHITRTLGIIACLPFSTFSDHRARWKELGFVSRMVPFAYSYPADLVAEIKDRIDEGTQDQSKAPARLMPRVNRKPITIKMNPAITRRVRSLADLKSKDLGQLGIRLLQNYHSLIRAHALLYGRTQVMDNDLAFLRDVDHFVSITECKPLQNGIAL